MARYFYILLFVALALPAPAFADEYDLPDPPNAITFDTIPLKVAAAPNEQIPSTCETRYRAGMESSFQKVWAQCRSVGQLTPSDCQRAVFSRCTDLATNLQKLEASTCTTMLGESDAVAAFQNVDTQKTAQSSTADLNARAYVATQRVIAGLESSQKAMQAQQKLAGATIGASACANSTAAASYQKAQGVVSSAITGTQTHLSAMIQSKKAAAAQFATNSGLSSGNLAKLVSATPVSVKSVPATTSQSTISSGTVVETIISTNSPTTPPPGPTAVVVPSSSTSSPAAQTQLTPVPLDPSLSSNNINWVPIAIGVPAAILAAIVISKMSKNHPGGDSSATGSGPDSGSNLPDPGAGGPMQGDGGRNPTPSAVPGGGDLAAWKITVDPSFTDQERAIIATGFAKIPSCYRYKLQGIYVKNQNLKHMSDGSCVAGMFLLGGNIVYLSPTCRVAIGITVHEFFHVLGNRNGNELHHKWEPVRNAHPNCPVTPYGATNFYEDFAESGRLLEYPDSSAEAKNPGACVDAKIQGLGQVMSQCPAGSAAK